MAQQSSSTEALASRVARMFAAGEPVTADEVQRALEGTAASASWLAATAREMAQASDRKFARFVAAVRAATRATR